MWRGDSRGVGRTLTTTMISLVIFPLFDPIFSITSGFGHFVVSTGIIVFSRIRGGCG